MVKELIYEPVCGLRPIFPSLRKLRQDYHELYASLKYYEDTILKKKKNPREKIEYIKYLYTGSYVHPTANSRHPGDRTLPHQA